MKTAFEDSNYTHGERAIDCIVITFLFATNMARITMGDKGNKVHEISTLFIHILLGFPACLGHIFLILWQTNILQIDSIINSIAIIFIGLEIIFALLAIVTFYNFNRNK